MKLNCEDTTNRIIIRYHPLLLLAASTCMLAWSASQTWPIGASGWYLLLHSGSRATCPTVCRQQANEGGLARQQAFKERARWLFAARSLFSWSPCMSVDYSSDSRSLCLHWYRGWFTWLSIIHSTCWARCVPTFASELGMQVFFPLSKTCPFIRTRKKYNFT